MNIRPKELVQLFIVISAWVTYSAMVFLGKANIEGYIALTVYIVKKFLDMIENGKNESPKV